MENNQAIQLVNIDNIIPNRFQPRLTFDEQGLNELSSSIKEHGIIQPLVLRKLGDKYEIIAGERRYKASVLAGLTELPAIISNLDDNKSAEVALVENVQRRNLSSIEEAKSYKKILDKGYLTQEELAKKIGVNQSTVANKLRLLNLSETVQDALLNERISERHARSLLQLKDFNEQDDMLNKIINERLTVRQLDAFIKEQKQPELNQNTDINLEPLNLDDNQNTVEPLIEENQNIFETEIIDAQLEEIEEIQPILDIVPEENTTLEKKELIIDNIETLDIFSSEEIEKPQQTSKLLNIFEKQSYPSLEDEKVNLSFEFSSDNIFDEHVPVEPITNETDLKEPEIEPKEVELPKDSKIIIEETKSKIISGNLETVTNSFKELEKEIKEAGFKIITEEFDFEDLYQIIIKIDKQDN